MASKDAAGTKAYEAKDGDGSNALLQGCDYVRFTTHDLNGIPRGVLIPGRRAAECVKTGIPFYCGADTYAANNRIIFPPIVIEHNLGNATLKLDSSSFHVTPWLGGDKYKTGQVFGEVIWDDGSHQRTSSRHAARRQLQELESMGMNLLSGVEWEYILSDKATGQPLFSGNDFNVCLVYAEYDSWFMDVDQAMLKAGVRINTMHPEYASGQFEFSTSPGNGINAIDQSAILKQGIREMASKRGWEASFMAKNFDGQNGSGCHFSFSLWDMTTNKNKFYDESAPDGLSELARYWVGGVIKHALALTALCCPTTNCYKRLHGSWTPHLATWGFEDRNSMLRVKNKGEQGTFMENRLPSSLSNPYLVTAATLAAGLDGMRCKTACPQPGDIENALSLPRTLEEAMQALQADTVIVEAMSKELVELFVQIKTEIDIKAEADLTDNEEKLKVQKEFYLRLC